MDQKIAEFEALRVTIRQRGTVRMVLVPVVFIGWAVTAVATAAVITVAISTLVPLLVLVAGFEAIYAMHLNVERIGRYLQVFHEQDGGWENVAMTFGQRFPGTGPDPLFAQIFVFAISVNFLPVALGFEYPLELVFVLIPHLFAVYRIRMGRANAARQRKEDLERFASIRDGR